MADNDGELIDVIAPSAGESVTEAEVGEWHVKVGDTVAVDDAIVELETDKAAMDVPAPENGIIDELTAAVGDKVSSGLVETAC